MRSRASKQMTALARALGTKQAGLMARIEELGGGPRRLSELGADHDRIDDAVKGILARKELFRTPNPPDAAAIRELIESAW